MNAIFDKLSPLFNLAARLMMACIFLVAGWSKVMHYAGVRGFMEASGIPGALLPLVIAVELGGALALVLGFQTRLAALLLAGFSLLAATLVHLHPGDQEQMIVFMDNLAMAGGLLLFVQYGGGAFSVDRRMRRTEA